MENEYGITVTNKYALFLSGDEDPLQILQRQLETKLTTKKEKQKKNAKEKEAKTVQPIFSDANQVKNVDTVDQFSSPSNIDDLPEQSTGVSESQFEQPKSGRQTRDRTRARGFNSARGRGRGGFNSNALQNSEFFERQQRSGRDRNGPRFDRFSGQSQGAGNFRQGPPRFDTAKLAHQDGFTESGTFESSRADSKSDDASGIQTERGYFGERLPRRAGFRGRRVNRGRPYGDRFDRARFEDRDRPPRSGFDGHDADRGDVGSSERPSRNGFIPYREPRARRGMRGRGGGFRRPPHREYQTGQGRFEGASQSEAGLSEQPANAPAETEHEQQTSLNVDKDDSGTWAEQLDAAEQAAAKTSESQQPVKEPDDTLAADKETENVMTLDEWRAQQDGKRAKADFNIRKPGEGCSGDPQWKQMIALAKKEKPEDATEDDELEEERPAGKTKNVLPIEIHFADESSRGRGRGGVGPGAGGAGRPFRGGRGGRGAGRVPPYARDRDRVSGDSYRGGRGGSGYGDQRPYRRGGNRGGEFRREYTPNFEDEMDFPSLDKSHGGSGTA